MVAQKSSIQTYYYVTTLDLISFFKKNIVGPRFSDWAPSNRWDPGPTDLLQWIYREWVQGLGFDETTVNIGVGDGRVGAKNTEVDRLTIRGNELLVRGYEFPSGLIRQKYEGGICAPSLPGSRNPPPMEDLLCYVSLSGPSSSYTC